MYCSPPYMRIVIATSSSHFFRVASRAHSSVHEETRSDLNENASVIDTRREGRDSNVRQWQIGLMNANH